MKMKLVDFAALSESITAALQSVPQHKRNLTMQLQFTEVSPMRIAAFGSRYTDLFNAGQVFQTLEDARSASHFGDWICSVSLFGVVLFFTRYAGAPVWLKAGAVTGRWNELTLVELVGPPV